jgi:hypothetical protein
LLPASWPLLLIAAACCFWATAVGKLRGLESLRSKLDDANASLAERAG